jgi:hypothetical protein
MNNYLLKLEVELGFDLIQNKHLINSDSLGLKIFSLLTNIIYVFFKDFLNK